jgi:hypothetical protein
MRDTRHYGLHSKTKGYNLEHNFGHGKQNLAAILATLNLFAFACHTVCDQLEPLWRLARSKTTRMRFFHRVVELTTFLVFSSWDDFLQTLAFLKPPPQPP